MLIYNVVVSLYVVGQATNNNGFFSKTKDSRAIAPGDFIVIPAMTGHQYIPDKNDTLVYWAIKIQRVK